MLSTNQPHAVNQNHPKDEQQIQTAYLV